MSGDSDTVGAREEFWLFGYGSLIWKPPPHYDQRIPGYVEGYVRRFWQASQDHRGTPEAPGRVVTLIERSFWETLEDVHTRASDKVWGVAYRIKPEKVDEVKNYLDIREINGYSIHYTPFHPADPTTVPAATMAATISTLPTIRCLVYIGLPNNSQFVGSQDPQKLAEHILRSKGPSGENKEYLLMLERALEELAADSEDEHVMDLANRLRQLEAQAASGVTVPAEVEHALAVDHELNKSDTTDEQEEVETQ